MSDLNTLTVDRSHVVVKNPPSTIGYINTLLESTSFGNILNVIGLLITILGFITAIRTARSAKNAAQKAEIEVIKVREDMGKLRTVADFSSAVTLMEEIKRLHRLGSWEDLPDRYSSLRNLLVTARSGNQKLSDEHKSLIQNALLQFSTMEHKVDRHLIAKQTKPDVSQLNNIVSKQIDNIRGILVEIQNSVGE